MKLRNLILEYALQNAIFYKGKANPSAVLGKIISQSPEARSNIKETRSLVEQTVRQVNLMSLDEQRKALRKLAPEMLEREEKRQEGLSDLPDAKEGLRTRFAPSPTGPLSIGQFMRAVFLSHAYARKYKGKFIVRVEDTDAKKIEPGAYEWIKEDLIRMGTKWDSLVLQSDRLSLYHKFAKEMIELSKGYVCSCSPENFRKHKLSKRECPCRANDKKKNLELWNAMVRGELEEGSAVLRFMGNMSDPNPVLRDPPLLRINKAKHPLKGTKFSVWPLYNFACVVDDHDLEITHVFRGKEHEHNTEVQKRIADVFKWKFPNVINFGMIRFPDEKIHTRDIKEMIAEGKVKGWDDPRLPTIRSLLKRGFQPEAIKSLALQCGLSKNDIELSWENLDTQNRKLIDPIANRYMVVIEPVKLSIDNAPEKHEVFEPLHPDHADRGKKKIPLNHSRIYISKDDHKVFSGKFIRLKGLYNITLGKRPRFSDDLLIKEMPKIQWVSEPNVKVRVVNRDGTLEGLGEPELTNTKPNELIQMERIGFGRIDSNNRREVVVYFAHK
ncbi:MAG: glutamate--tRNA ligase [Candidatus Aenigmarchaeota archaeon]|nr:glutamate--tRNA ligase [Candidatus Aenigmarchaeota archaeon]NIP40789.1 glutamate--tRNA ligase [Candidatus Aenigmarchaeota archaeon]NIQ17903.1 glutamate--tRNA ligase [Candidatus Aenigmarchaeota archaeon]NIS73492.1 glutamate--tRNA ligase [Candidatus Aenigmarchaeota archaeon]